MGLLASLRPGVRPGDLRAAASLVDPYVMPVAMGSPWAPTSHLASVVVEDLFGLRAEVMNRGDAMRVPAVARARHIICGTIARIELADYRGDVRLPDDQQPTWLTAADGPVSPLHRMLWTVDDLMFYGWSLWRITERTADGRLPLRMARVPMQQWQFEPGTNRVLTLQADGAGGWTWQVTPPRDVVLIPGGHEGLLCDGQDTLHHARDLERSAHNAGRFPSAYLGLEQTSGNPLKRRSDDETEVTVETILADWRKARNNPEGGGVAWLGGVKAHEIGSFDSHLLESGRNAAAVDVARHASIPADLIDATVTESSLHYSTSRDNDRRFIDYGLGLYMSAISARLSQDDVTPRGQRVAFDLEQWLRGAAPAPGQDATRPAPGLATAPAAPAAPAGPADSQETPQ
ncbi:MAG: phage portal protein [Mycobacterium sp.]